MVSIHLQLVVIVVERTLVNKFESKFIFQRERFGVDVKSEK